MKGRIKEVKRVSADGTVTYNFYPQVKTSIFSGWGYVDRQNCITLWHSEAYGPSNSVCLTLPEAQDNLKAYIEHKKVTKASKATRYYYYKGV